MVIPAVTQADLGGSVGCSLTGDQEVAGSTPAGSETFFRGDHEIFSTDSRRAVVI